LESYGIAIPFYFAAGLSFVNAVALYFILPESIKQRRATAARAKEPPAGTDGIPARQALSRDQYRVFSAGDVLLD